MSMVDDIIPEGAEPPEEPTEEAPSEAPLASQEPDSPGSSLTEELPEPAAEEEAPAPEAEWVAAIRQAGYGNLVDQYQADPVKLAKALADAKAYATSKQQPEPQPEPEQQPELMVGDIVWPPESIPELYAAAQNPEFAGHAAIWAMENRHRIPQQAFQDVVNNWWYTNPAQAQAYQIQQQLAEFRATFEQQIRPVQEHTAKTVSDAAQSLAQQQIDQRVPGDWQKYRAQIAELCNDPQASSFFFRHGETPEGLAQGIRDAYGWIKQQEWLQQGGQAPQTPAAPAPQAAAEDRPRDENGRFAATTSGRGSAPSRTPTKDEELVDAIIGV